ncbi:PLP-dependent aminotransferase family protein [Marinibaculum pumilum]|uniref:PLP-dependent aminotransferase family protein n=1 Tax=Marinibaculum pumilum TaxID=1766165 RepID=A0ABV7L6U0_9PROT
MTIWTPDLRDRDGPRYAAIAHAIADAVATGELPPGSRLPTHRDLAYRLGCTVGTVSRAYAAAEQQGLIAGEVGRGTFVRRDGRGAPTPAAADGPPPRPELRRGAGIAAIRHAADMDSTVDLSCNLPNVDLARDLLGRAMAEIGASPDLPHLLGYPPAAGFPAHRAAVSRWVGRHGVRAAPDQVILTAGTQQALGLSIQSLLPPGGILLCEDPAYAGLRDVAALANVRLHGVAMDENGMRADALAAAARETGARVVAVTPTLQNPTTVSMDARRRAEIAACAEEHDLVVIEDDVYGDLPLQRPPALAALAADRVIYAGSLSKCLAPALRLGWAVAPTWLADRLSDRLSGLTLNTSPLNAELGRIWTEQFAEASLPALRRDIAQRQRLARAALSGLEVAGDPEALHLLLMLPAGWSEADFVRATREAGIRLAGLDAFRLRPDEARPGVRLNVTALSDLNDLVAAVEQLAYLLRRARPSAERVI